MAAFGFLVVLVLALIVMSSRLYSGGKRPSETELETRREDRLATLLDPDLMEALLTRSQREGRPAVGVLNDLLREALRDPGP